MDSDESKRIWEHAKSYRVASADRHRFARFLFVPLPALSKEVISKLSETDKNILSLRCMQDKAKVFNVVYDHTAQHLGEPLMVRDDGAYLVFLKKTEKDDG